MDKGVTPTFCPSMWIVAPSGLDSMRIVLLLAKAKTGVRTKHKITTDTANRFIDPLPLQ